MNDEETRKWPLWVKYALSVWALLALVGGTLWQTLDYRYLTRVDYDKTVRERQAARDEQTRELASTLDKQLKLTDSKRDKQFEEQTEATQLFLMKDKIADVERQINLYSLKDRYGEATKAELEYLRNLKDTKDMLILDLKRRN